MQLRVMSEPAGAVAALRQQLSVCLWDAWLAQLCCMHVPGVCLCMHLVIVHVLFQAGSMQLLHS